MDGEVIDDVMELFLNGLVDVLIVMMIVEFGLDIFNCNMIIIENV